MCQWCSCRGLLPCVQGWLWAGLGGMLGVSCELLTALWGLPPPGCCGLLAGVCAWVWGGMGSMPCVSCRLLTGVWGFLLPGCRCWRQALGACGGCALCGIG